MYVSNGVLGVRKSCACVFIFSNGGIGGELFKAIRVYIVICLEIRIWNDEIRAICINIARKWRAGPECVLWVNGP